MLVKYSYRVKTDMYLPEQWPLCWDRYRLEWTIEQEKVTSLTVVVRTDSRDFMPKITAGDRPRISANIHIGEQPYQSEVEQMLRTAIGLLNFFAQIDVDFGAPTLAWEAENDEERAQLQMYSFSLQHKIGSDEERPPLSYDIVARCFLAAPSASSHEVLLSFVRKGRRDMRDGHFIDAYYSFFFFLETQFAPGYSDPKKVKAALKTVPGITEALAKARAMSLGRKGGRRAAFLAKADDELIDYLVDVRGQLHHHALPRKTNVWHPDKHQEFEEEAIFLEFLTHTISMDQAMPILFSEEVSTAFMNSAEQQGAVIKYAVTGKGRTAGACVPLSEILWSVPGATVTHAAVSGIEAQIREKGYPDARGLEIIEYEIASEDKSRVYARYRSRSVD